MSRPIETSLRTVESTPRAAAAPLVTGYFHSRAGYAVSRAQGTCDWLLFFTLAGEGRVGSSAGDIAARPGRLILLPPRTPHDYGVERRLQRWDFLWAHFVPRSEWLDWLAWPASAPGILGCDPSADLRARIHAHFLEAHAYANGAYERREALALNALAAVLLCCAEANASHDGRVVDERVQRVQDYLATHLAERIRIADAARVARLSVSRLAHLFRAETGRSPQQYLELLRIARARQLLERTPLPVKCIAGELGFENPFYFTARFKRHTGISPRAYRERCLRREALLDDDRMLP